jgi:hypothetical protein
MLWDVWWCWCGFGIPCTTAFPAAHVVGYDMLCVSYMLVPERGELRHLPACCHIFADMEAEMAC